VESPVVPENLIQNYTAEAVRFLEANHKKPFFLYLAHTMPHIPLAASAEFLGKSKYGLYGDVVEELDASVGRVLDAIEALGVDDQTMLFVMSDNGPWPGDAKTNGGSTGELRGSKGTTWEGGLRVPFLARAPGRLPAGETRDGIATLMDLFPTISAAVGSSLPDGVFYDGRNILGLLEGSAESPHDEVFFSDTKKLHAIRSGAWKLKLYDRAVDRKGRTRAAHENQAPQLYNLTEDPGEKNDIAADHPEIVARMLLRGREFREGLEPTMNLPPRGRSVVGGILTQGPKSAETVPK
jgi:arylsulfatase A-like enzyme